MSGVPRSSAWWFPGLLCLALVGEALAEPTKGTIVLKTGRRWEGCEYEIKGDRVHVKFANNRGGTEIAAADVASFIPDAAAPAEGAEEGEAGEEAGESGPSTVDWEGRFRLEPPEGWAAAATTSPLMRALIVHEERDAGLAVFIRQVPGSFVPDPATRGVPKEITDSIGADLSARYARAQGHRVTVDKLFETPVLRVEAQIFEHGSNEVRKLVELRFRRFGLEYSLAYTVHPQHDGALAASLGTVFEAFTFLPTVTHSPSEYSDYGRGFAITRPNEDWQLLGSPFDQELPVRVITDGGRAELNVAVHDSTDPEAVVRAIMAKRQQSSRHFGESKVEAGEQRGTAVKRFHYEDFNPGGSKKLRFEGFSAVLAGKVVVVTAIHPVSDEDAKKLEGDLAAMLTGARLWDEEHIRRALGDSQNAIALLSQGAAAAAQKKFPEAIDKFDQAIRLCPGFARAYYMRALAKRDQKDARGYREDLEFAANLDPAGGYEAGLTDSYLIDAQAAEAAGNIPEALRLRLRVYRASKSPQNLQLVTNTATKVWADAKRDSKQIPTSITAIERDLMPLKNDAPIATYLASVYREAAQIFMREGNFSKAKTYGRKARTISTDPALRQQADTLLTQIEQAEDRAGGR